jgi:hypothetical protein
LIWRKFTFNPISTTAIRVLVNAGLNSFSRIAEVEAWTVGGGPPANISPTVNLTSPSNNATYPAPATVNLSADAADADGAISKIEFYRDATLIATVTTPSSGTTSSGTWIYSDSNVAAGTYSYTAKAYDNGVPNAVTTSGAALVSVTPAGGSVNAAAQANGGVATASSIYGGGIGAASGANNGDRKGLNWSSGGIWHDGTVNVFPDWLQISFNGTKSIGEIDVFFVQDNYNAPIEPTPSMTFDVNGFTGVIAFQVQYLNGGTWVDVPGGNVTGNNLIWRKFTFNPISTTAIRVLVNAGLNSFSRIAEVEAWTVVNAAAQANGGVATASSIYGGGIGAASGANNGDRKGLNWSSGGIWHDGTVNVFPDWLQISFNGTKSIGEIDVFFVQDNYNAPIEPTPSMTFDVNGFTGVTAFQVQYLNGGTWVDVPGGNVTGNNLIWRKFTFNPISTTAIRVLVNAGLNSFSRIAEVEAWGQ